MFNRRIFFLPLAVGPALELMAQEPPDSALVASTAAGSMFYITNKDWANGSDMYPRVWIHEDASRNRSVKYRYTKSLYDFQCKEKTLKIVSLVKYAADGSVISNYRAPSYQESDIIVPESVAEGWLTAVCPPERKG